MQKCTKEILSFIQAHNQRGAGYWIWKPYIIWKTLQDVEDGDIVCYIDSACLINKGKEWSIATGIGVVILLLIIGLFISIFLSSTFG